MGIDDLSAPERRGILMAGGAGTRLGPLTWAVSKHLLPIYDKPLIYYPLATLISAGIRKIAVISTPQDEMAYRRLLGDGRQWGIELAYRQQAQPNGIAEAFLLARDFIAGRSVALALGDNVFCGFGMDNVLREAMGRTEGATIFATPVNNPQDYGVVEVDDDNRAISLEEKPSLARSNLAVVGLYFYDAWVMQIAERLKPSARGELEITDVNRAYLNRNELTVARLPNSIAWIDAGTPERMQRAGTLVSLLRSEFGTVVGDPEASTRSANFATSQHRPGIASDIPRLQSGMAGHPDGDEAGESAISIRTGWPESVRLRRDLIERNAAAPSS